MTSEKIGKFFLASLLACATAQLSQGQTYAVLHSFSGGSDGANPEAVLIVDNAGNLYGTTEKGGVSNAGTVFKVDASGNESPLYSFTGGADGSGPAAGLLLSANGNLYGTTELGGTLGVGVVFALAPSGVETVLYDFGRRKDGKMPAAALIQDSAGNLLGTTVYGGMGRGIVFRLDSTNHETVLHRFTGGFGGSYAYAGLIPDSKGNFYGTTYGTNTVQGTVYKMTASGTVTVLHNFTGLNDGGWPRAGLVMDSAGMLNGTTVYGGSHRAGTVFKVDPSTGQETVLYNFSGKADGGDPYGTLVRDASGNLYGTTFYGGAFGGGTIFKLDTAGNETVLHSFNGSDGQGPMAGLTWDRAGNLYGTTLYGGANGAGVVFKLVP